MNIKRLDKDDYKKLQNPDDDLEINQNQVILRFIDFDFNPDEITAKLGLTPLQLRGKGKIILLGKGRLKKLGSTIIGILN